MTIFTRLAAAIFAPFDSAGNKRSVDNGDAVVWGTEVERLLASGGFKTINEVGPFSGRGVYNAQPKGFTYLSIDGDGATTSEAVGFIKKSNTSGDWSVPVPWQGIQGPQGEDGESFKVDETGLLADRANFDGAPAGFSFLATDVRELYIRQGVSGWSVGIPFGTGDKGDAGWSAVLAVATDGVRRVLRVTDWTGGEGDKPTTLGYVGATGIVPAIANGVDVRGATGANGSPGNPGTPGTAGADGAKWYSGSGAPSGSTGVNGDFYLQNTAGGGGVVGDVWQKAAGAWSIVANIRGASGAGTGDVVGPASATDNRIARFNGTTGKLLKDGGTVATADMADNVITYAKMQDVSATARVLGRKTAGSGDPEELSLSDVLDMIGSAAQGDVLFRGAAGWSRLPKGSALQVLRQNTALTAPEWGSAREVLTANRTYYVRSDGSDSNNGLTNAAGGAFMTIQKAIDTARALDLSIYSVAIVVGAGTFAQNVTIDSMVGGPAGANQLSIQGAGRSSTTIGAGGGFGVTARGGARVNVGGFKLGANTIGLYADGGGTRIQVSSGLGAIEFDTMSSRYINSTSGAYIIVGSDIYMSGNAPRALVAQIGGIISFGGMTFYSTAALAFSTSFADASDMSLIVRTASAPFDLTGGAVTGKRYSGATNAVINSAGSGASYFPGDVAGTVATGASYA